MKIITRLLAFVRGYWFLLAFAFASLVVATLLGIAIPNLLGDGIDAALGSGTHAFLFFQLDSAQSVLWWVAGAIIIASIIRGISGYLQRYLNELVAQKTTYMMRNAL